MKRYYYTDPLAAAWMAKHHKIKFANGDNLRSALEMAGDICKRMPFEIHADSLHLLEPRPGDMVTNTFHGNKGRECSGIISNMMNDGESASIITAERHNGKHYFCESVKNLTIIQRNGVAFMWPESEESAPC